MMSKLEKRRARKMSKLVSLTNEIKNSLDKSIGDYAHKHNEQFLTTSCILYNALGKERLKDNDFDAKLMAGKAAFGFNASQYGMIEFDVNAVGYFLEYGVAPGFSGHCWIYVPSLEVVVDLTLADLKQRVIDSNKQTGIDDDEFLLDSSMVIPVEKIMDYQSIKAGAVGLYYEQTCEAAEMVKRGMSEYKHIFSALA
ncbi:hypothetical protein [Vibrio barjaei]|uniref:hypothetical protein n=1 Tax=Vibrio barjaei TaxID=1676683 RepID=UPI0022842FB1|nr:hypothetical protein [Vibrio barjaei]MCY9872350.1 hypothetical protein [Vibrio barjaei]